LKQAVLLQVSHADLLAFVPIPVLPSHDLFVTTPLQQFKPCTAAFFSLPFPQVGIKDGRLRKWLLSIAVFLRNQNQGVLDAIGLWKANLEQEFAGVEPCLVCMCVISTVNGQVSMRRCCFFETKEVWGWLWLLLILVPGLDVRHQHRQRAGERVVLAPSAAVCYTKCEGEKCLMCDVHACGARTVGMALRPTGVEQCRSVSSYRCSCCWPIQKSGLQVLSVVL
jgi:hypothetical protein